MTPLVLRVCSRDGRRIDDGPAASFGEAGGSVGRSEDSTLVLVDPGRTISRCHVLVLYDGRGFVLVAKGTHPTWLNGRELARDEALPLAPGDRILLGSYEIEVDAAGGPPPSADALPARTRADDVRLASAAMRAVEPGESFLLQTWVYPAGHDAALRDALELPDPAVATLLGRRSCRWPPGALVELRVSCEDLVCDEPVQTLVWNGGVEMLDFVLTAPPDAEPGERVVTLRVHVGPLVVATWRHPVALLHDAAGATRAVTFAQAAGSAYASFAACDRERVAPFIAALELAAGLDVFSDGLDQRPGNEWKPRLADEIRGRDLFLLFWSREARASRWVEWEWRQALATRGLPAMQVHALQAHLDPPPDLTVLHVDPLQLPSIDPGATRF